MRRNCTGKATASRSVLEDLPDIVATNALY